MIETVGIEKKINAKRIIQAISEIFPDIPADIFTEQRKEKTNEKSLSVEIYYKKGQFKTTLFLYGTPKEHTEARELYIALFFSKKFKCKTIINSGNIEISNSPYYSLMITKGNFYKVGNSNSSWFDEGKEDVKIIGQAQPNFKKFDKNGDIDLDIKRPEQKKKIIWNAEKFLNLVLFFLSLRPNRERWSTSGLFHERETIRFLRILSLMKAFKIENDKEEIDFTDFIDGEAFNYYELSEYKEIIGLIEEYSISLKEPFSFSDIQDFFYHLLTYRITVERTLRIYEYTMEVGFKGHLAGYNMVQEEIKKIKINIKPIDELLIKLIDPQRKEFSEYELIKDYDFPEDDLNKIDDDFWENL